MALNPKTQTLRFRNLWLQARHAASREIRTRQSFGLQGFGAGGWFSKLGFLFYLFFC